MRPITYQKSINTKHKLNAYKRYLSKHISLLGTSCLFTQDTNKIYPLNNQIVVTDIFCGLVCYFLLFVYFVHRVYGSVWWISLWLEWDLFKHTQQITTGSLQNRHHTSYTCLNISFQPRLHLCILIQQHTSTPSPIWDNLIMFTLARMIYPNVAKETLL